MNRPYIICHMMSTLDGRIDCEMTSKIKGVHEYYDALENLNLNATLSGRVTAQLEMAEKGEFIAKDKEPLKTESFSKKITSEKYDIVVDTKGHLLWKERSDTPLIIITTSSVTKEYLKYLDDKNISWIACGKKEIDLLKAMEILFKEFNVKRLGVVGGGTINAGFLKKGLLDEINVLLSNAIDGRKGMTCLFDGLPMDIEPFVLELKNVVQYNNGTLLLQYYTKTKKI